MFQSVHWKSVIETKMIFDKHVFALLNLLVVMIAEKFLGDLSVPQIF